VPVNEVIGHHAHESRRPNTNPFSSSSSALRFRKNKNFLLSMFIVVVCWAKLGGMNNSTPSCFILRYGETSRRESRVSTDTSVELPPQDVNESRSTAA